MNPLNVFTEAQEMWIENVARRMADEALSTERAMRPSSTPPSGVEVPMPSVRPPKDAFETEAFAQHSTAVDRWYRSSEYVDVARRGRDMHHPHAIDVVTERWMGPRAFRREAAEIENRAMIEGMRAAMLACAPFQAPGYQGQPGDWSGAFKCERAIEKLIERTRSA